MPLPPPPEMSKFTAPKLLSAWPAESLVVATKTAPSNSPLPPPNPSKVVVPSPITRIIPFHPELPWYTKFPVTTRIPYPVLGPRWKLPSPTTTIGLLADIPVGQHGLVSPDLQVVPLLQSSPPGSRLCR